MSKKNYFCILRSPAGNCEQPASPSDMEAMYAKYQAWQEKFSTNIVDMGGKLKDSGAVVSQSEVKDGPYVEAKELIGGYMTLAAESMEEAIAVIKGSPMVMNPDVSIEIREIATP